MRVFQSRTRRIFPFVVLFMVALFAFHSGTLRGRNITQQEQDEDQDEDEDEEGKSESRARMALAQAQRQSRRPLLPFYLRAAFFWHEPSPPPLAPIRPSSGPAPALARPARLNLRI